MGLRCHLVIVAGSVKSNYTLIFLTQQRGHEWERFPWRPQTEREGRGAGVREKEGAQGDWSATPTQTHTHTSIHADLKWCFSGTYCGSQLNSFQYHITSLCLSRNKELNTITEAQQNSLSLSSCWLVDLNVESREPKGSWKNSQLMNKGSRIFFFFSSFLP